MAGDDPRDSPHAKALRRRKELQETIRNAVQEIEKIEEWLKMYRSFSTDTVEDNKGATSIVKLGGAAHGTTQSIFEARVLSVLRDVGRPMKSPEIIDEFRRRGHPVQGNEIRTAWNRLWEAKSRGVLTNDPQLGGYWVAGEPLSEAAIEQARIAGKRRRSGVSAAIKANRGKKKGPPRALTPEQVETIERLLLSGKSRKEITELYGISMVTLASYMGRTADFVARHPGFVPPKPPYRPPRPGQKRGGRPRTWTTEQERQVLEMRAQGKSVREIIEATGVKRTTIYKIFDEQGVEVRESPMRLINRAGEELEIGEKVVHSGSGRIGKIDGLIEPSPRHPKGAIKVIWAGDSESTDTLPSEIDAGFK